MASVEALEAGVDALRSGDADAFVYAGDAMVGSQARLVIDRALMKGLPTIFADREDVVSGALSSYGVSYYEIGRLSARNVRRILQGTDPGDLPMERVDRLHLAINLKTAKALGLTMPPSLLAQVDEVIE